MRYDKMTHSEFVTAIKSDRNLCLIAYASQEGDENWSVWKDKKHRRYYLLNDETFFEVLMVANLYFNTNTSNYIENRFELAVFHMALGDMFPHDYYSLTVGSRINHWWFIKKGSKKHTFTTVAEVETVVGTSNEAEPAKDDFTQKVKKLHELTTEYMALEDDLSSAGAHSRLSYEIEEMARQICMQNTDLTDDELIEFLDEHHVKQ